MARNFFWILITIILAPIFYSRIFLWNLFGGKNGGKKDLKILVLATGKIGDLVCTTPVFQAIKKKFPKSYLVVSIREQSYGVVQNNPHIDKFIFLNSEKYQGFLGKIRLVKEVSKEKFNWSINLSSHALNTILPFWAGVPKRITSTSKLAGKTARLFFLFNDYRKEYHFNELESRHDLDLLTFLGIKKAEDKREVFYTGKEAAKVNKLLKGKNVSKRDFLVGISVTAGNKFKEWEPEKFSQLADKIIKELKGKILFIGNKEDKKTVAKVISKMREKAIDFSGLVNLATLPVLITKLDLFISVDTGPLYIATALDVPVIDINGPFNVEEQMLLGAKAEIVENKIYCQPCSHKTDPKNFCKEGHLKCIREIRVKKVFHAVKKMIKKYNLKS